MKGLAGRTLECCGFTVPHPGVTKVGKGLQDHPAQPTTTLPRALSAPSRDNPAVSLSFFSEIFSVDNT